MNKYKRKWFEIRINRIECNKRGVIRASNFMSISVFSHFFCVGKSHNPVLWELPVPSDKNFVCVLSANGDGIVVVVVEHYSRQFNDVLQHWYTIRLNRTMDALVQCLLCCAVWARVLIRNDSGVPLGPDSIAWPIDTSAGMNAGTSPISIVIRRFDANTPLLLLLLLWVER